MVKFPLWQTGVAKTPPCLALSHAPAQLPAFGRRLDRHRTAIDDAKIRLGIPTRFDKLQTASPQQGGQLLAFVLVDLAAECLN